VLLDCDTIITIGLIGGAMAAKCYDFFGCKKSKCPMFFEDEQRNCWDVPNTSCLLIDDGGSVEIDGDKKFFCKNCLYFQHVNEVDS